MSDDQHQPLSPWQAWKTWTRQDPEWEEAKRRLWAMTPDERVRAMRTGELSLRLCLHWASCRPDEVPLLDGEWEFIAVHTPEIADAHEPASSQRERVQASLLRCPDRDERDAAH
jgi:hypothetical protein